MKQNIDVHKVFADYFDGIEIQTLAYAVSKNLSEGHICLDIINYNQLIVDTAIDDLLELNPFLVEGFIFRIEEIEKSCFVSKSNKTDKAFIIHGHKIYLQRYFLYETEIIEQINKFINYEKKNLAEAQDILLQQKDFIKTLFETTNTSEVLSKEEQINWQLVATLSVLQKNISIITGGPGTGKTTTMAKILAILYRNNPDLKVAIAAPTGKAAARMKESLGQARDYLPNLSSDIKKRFDDLEAKTIHRLLGYLKNSPYFRHNKDNTLEYDFIIVDESSMISAPLMAKLLNAVSPHSRLVLLGDKNQLASVEAGSVFGDICLAQGEGMNKFSSLSAEFINSFITNDEAKIPDEYIDNKPLNKLLDEHIVELKRSHRFKADQGIGLFSKALINGYISDEDYGNSDNSVGEYVRLEENYTSPLLNQFMHKYKTYICEKNISKALIKINEVRFLCAVHEGKYGVKYYNQLIEKYLHSKSLLYPKEGFYENQAILITKNDYSLGLYNGDVGIIRKDKNNILKAWFEGADGELKQILPGFISAFDTVFAMTIHKSQGSEFSSVALILPDDENLSLLTRELLYTAITRAKKEVVVFGRKAVINDASQRKVERASGIIERIK